MWEIEWLERWLHGEDPSSGPISSTTCNSSCRASDTPFPSQRTPLLTCIPYFPHITHTHTRAFKICSCYLPWYLLRLFTKILIFPFLGSLGVFHSLDLVQLRQGHCAFLAKSILCRNDSALATHSPCHTNRRSVWGHNAVDILHSFSHSLISPRQMAKARVPATLDADGLLL